MKTKFFCLVLFMSLLKSNVFAQQDFLREPDTHKPLLFADLPSEIPVPVTELDKIMLLLPGASATLVPAGSFSFHGIVRSVTRQNDNKLLTVILRLSGRAEANLVLSAITGEDGSIDYTAKIISFQHGDCFVLQKGRDYAYSFIKKNFYELVSE